MSFSKTSPLNINTRAIDLVSNDVASVPPFKLKRAQTWVEPWNMARLMRVVAQKSRRLTSPKSTASNCILATHNNAVIVLNQCLALHPLHANIVGDHLLADVLQCPLPPPAPSEDASEVPSEEGGLFSVPSEMFEVPSEASSEHGGLFAVPSEEYDGPTEEEMADAFDQLLPTQPGFIMQSPHAEVPVDIGDCAELPEIDLDPDFERSLIATIQASAILHASEGTTMTMDDFFALHALVTRATDGTSTPQDRATVEFLMQALQ